MMPYTKYQGSIPCGSRQEDFFSFSLNNAYVKHVKPGAGHFWSQGHNLSKLGRCQLGDASYQISRL